MKIPEALALQYWQDGNTQRLVELLTNRIRGRGWHTCMREHYGHHRIYVGRDPISLENIDTMEFCWYLVVYKLPNNMTNPYYQIHYKSKGVDHSHYINVVTTVGEIMATLHAGLAFSHWSRD